MKKSTVTLALLLLIVFMLFAGGRSFISQRAAAGESRAIDGFSVTTMVV